MKIPNRKPIVSEENVAISSYPSELSSNSDKPSYPNVTLPIELEDMSQPTPNPICPPIPKSIGLKLNRDAKLSLLRPNTLTLQEAYNEKTKTESKLSIGDRSNLLTTRLLNYFLGKDDNAEERTYILLDTLCQRDPKTLLTLVTKLLAIREEFNHPSLIQNPNQLNQIVIMAPQKTSSTPSLPSNQILTVPTEKLSDDIKSSFAEIVRKHTKKD